MKYFRCGTVALFLLAGCSSQVPETVQSAFQAQHPNVTPAWEAQPYGYEAVFTQAGIEYEVEFSRAGQWLETEYEVSESQFSAAVIDRVKREYPNFAITKREIEITPNGTFYEVEVEQGEQEIELCFDQRGNPASNSNEDA